MQKLVLLFAFFLIQKVHGNDVVNILNFIENKKEVKSACYLEDDTDKNFSECLSDICGPSNQFKNYQDVIDDLDKVSVEEEKFEPFKNQIEKYYEKIINYTHTAIVEMKESISSDKVTLEPGHIILLKFMEVLNTLNKLDWDDFIEDTEINGNQIEFTTNSQNLKDALAAACGEKCSKRLYGPMLELLKNKNFQKMMFGSMNGWSLSIDHEYPGQSLKEILQKDKIEKEKILIEIKEKNPKVYEFIEAREIVKTKLIDKVQNDPNPSEALLDEYFKSMMLVRILEDYFVQSQPELSKFKPKTIYDFFPKEEIENKIKSREEELEGLNVQSSEIQTNVQHCQAIFQKNLAGLPTNKEREDFISTIDSYKNDFKKIILGKFSTETAKTLGPKIDGVVFDIPASRESAGELMLDSMKDLEVDIDKNIELKKRIDINKNDYTLIEIQDLMNSDFAKFTGEMGEVCDNYELGSLEDYSLQIGSGKIKVSWLTLKVPEIGKGIIAHELGHALSSIIRENELSKHSAVVFKQARLCINNGHYTKSDETITFKNEDGLKSETYEVDHFVEENWADVISANYLGENNKNFACFLVEKNDGDYDSNVLFPEDEEDTHAPDLLRVLKVQSLMKGSLPTSCKNLLKPTEIKYFEKKCI